MCLYMFLMLCKPTSGIVHPLLNYQRNRQFTHSNNKFKLGITISLFSLNPLVITLNYNIIITIILCELSI